MTNKSEAPSNTEGSISLAEKVTIHEKQYINPTNLIRNPSSPRNALKEPIRDPKKIKFIGFRFISIWVLPMAAIGIIMEFLFVAPIRRTMPFG